MTHLITLKGNVPSKKNSYNIRRTKGGGHTFYKDSDLQTQLTALEWQIPPSLKGLSLRHPEMVFRFDVPNKSQAADRDNKYQCVLDLLVKAKVLQDDCIRHCNGKHTILESEITDEHTTYIWITPREGQETTGSGKPAIPARTKTSG